MPKLINPTSWSGRLDSNARTAPPLSRPKTAGNASATTITNHNSWRKMRSSRPSALKLYDFVNAVTVSAYAANAIAHAAAGNHRHEANLGSFDRAYHALS